jgi:hypothetical protein
MATYEHTPLQSGEFRLLKLFPGEGTAVLEGSLWVRTLQARGSATGSTLRPDPEPYDALSYTWDEPRDGPSIRIVDKSQTHVIPVRPNLEAALLQLRHPRNHLYLWVDALCINQNDNKEKSEQIPLMSQIFSTANNVSVWLGPEEGDSGMAMRFVQRLMSDDFDQLVEDHRLSREWASLSNLMKRPWFSRRWIVQEIALAKSATLHCGREWISWDDFAYAVALFVYGQEKLQTVFRNSPQFYNDPDYLGDIGEYAGARLVRVADDIFRKGEDGSIMERMLPLEELMSTLSGFETTDPRDVLYAILSLAQDARPGFKDAFTSDADGFEPFADQFAQSPSSYVSFSEQSMGLSPAMAYNRAGSIGLRSRASSDARSETFITVAGGLAAVPVPLQARKRAPSNAEFIDGPARKQRKQEVPTFIVEDVGPTDTTTSSQDPAANSAISPGERANGEDSSSPSGYFVPRSSLTSLHLGVPPTRRRSSTDSSVVKRDEIVKRFAKTLKVKTIQNRIPVNYDKSVVDVCRDVLKFTVASSNSLDMICRPWAPQENSLPSWIPPVTRNPFGPGKNGASCRVNADPLVGQPERGPCFYKAARGRPAVVRFDNVIKTSLVASGFVLGVIKEKKSPAVGGVIPSEWNEAVGWTDVRNPPPDPFWRTLVGNRDTSGRRPQRLWRKACQKAFGLRARGGDLIVEKVVTYESPTFVKQYLKRVLQTVWSRRLAIVENSKGEELLCLTPQGAKKGDKVCILYGCSVPVLLHEYSPDGGGDRDRSFTRTSTSSTSTGSSSAAPPPPPPLIMTAETATGTTYKLIGECYVHGMMDGEAIKYQQKEKIEDRNFDLR